MTPLMKQYWDIKSLHQDKVLLFRMGDFFEMFFDDAVRAAPLLGIALTKRNKKSQDETPMCGMPHHSIAGPINKLLAHGLKVAICDQIEDPKLAKGIVKRAVTRILTPGMVYDAESLDDSRSHYIASLDQTSLSLLDPTTGEALYFESNQLKDLISLMESLPIAEIVTTNSDMSLVSSMSSKKWLLSLHEDSEVQSDFLNQDNFKNLQLPKSAIRILSYIQTLRAEALVHLCPFEKRGLEHRMNLGISALRHLEVFSTYRGEESGSLFHAIQRTKTSGGSRLLRQWLQFPLRDIKKIEERLSWIEHWRGLMPQLKVIRENLSAVGDLERRLSKVSQPQSNARDLLSLSDSIESALKAYFEVNGVSEQKYQKDMSLLSWKVLSELYQEIQKTFLEDPPLTTRQGFMVRSGLFAELDESIQLSTSAHKKIAEMEAKERELTGISSLKIRYNNVFGYYIEITNTHKEKVPSRYQRKQTLANAERFYTEELIELEKKVLTAQTRRFELEFEIYESLKKKVLTVTPEILKFSNWVSELDVLTSLSWLSLEEGYCRPQFHQEQSILLNSSRHPVVEQFVRKSFVANDLEIKSHSCLLLTGPNMAGKSTLMRQVALTVILAQMGSYIPAASAQLPIFDGIYTRIGASDQLTQGLSTFMVEMTETAEMLKNATDKSLLILDEVGRGTSTFDGLCLAQSILEYIIYKVHAMTLFATHYHELTQLQLREVQNAHMSVVEKDGQIRFLHTLVQGAAGKSYGIHVAELAGIPQEIVAKAKKLLARYEPSNESEDIALRSQSFSTSEAAVALGSHAPLTKADVKEGSIREDVELDQQLLSFKQLSMFE